MNKKLTEAGKFAHEGIDTSASIISAVFKLLSVTQADLSITSEMSQTFQVDEFQLGDELPGYNPGNNLSEINKTNNQGELYLVCQGRVRLLSTATNRQREVSCLVLETGEIFGGDNLLCDREITDTSNLLAYRSVAASHGAIARISFTKLQTYFPKISGLEESLRSTVKQRQYQIFCKTTTDLGILTSHQLREIIPYLIEKQIPAGNSLATVTPGEIGRYWLRSGQITSQEPIIPIENNGHKPQSNQQKLIAPCPTVGASWGYPEPPPADWIAHSDLVIYQVSTEHWQSLQNIAPNYFKISGKDNANNKHKKSRIDRTSPAITSAQINNKDSKSTSEATHSESPTDNSILFPTPTKCHHWFWQGYPFIEQQSSSDCGAACLAMISQYWGKRFTINYLRDLADVGRSGASIKNIAVAAENIGFHARPVRASLNKIAEQKNPWIAHWQGVHYIVVYWIKGDRILIADPAKGKQTISRQEFIANWSGYALLLDPTDRLQQTQSQKISLSRFFGALNPYRSIIWQIIFISLIVQIFGVITPLFTQIILDQVVVHKSFTTLNVFVLGLLLFNIWNIGLGATRQYLLSYFSNRLNLTLIGGFISHTLILPLKFFESRRVGDIITRVQENQKIQHFLISQVILAWLDMLTGIVYLGLMLYYNLYLTLLILGLVPPLVILTLVATPFLRKVSREIFNAAADQNSLMVEMLTGITTVKAAAAEKEIRWRWEDKFTSSINVGFRGQKLSIVLQTIGGSINSLGSTALLWYGATLVIQNDLTIGQFVAFNMMIGKVIGPVLALTNLWNELQEVLISVERLNDVFEATPEENPGNPMLILPSLRGEVQFDNVTFRYSSQQERNTLQNINFEVKPGQTVAIVGRSGSGKSTLVNLLQGFYHPDSGRILIDGHDIRHVSPQSLRSQLGVVPQECFLFSGTVLDNIALYRTEFNLEQVTEVAKLAEAHAFIQDLSLGYNTKVGERGANLSGGQRQRIAIARALLGEPRILVLDEATSSLDTESERRFQQNLERLSRDRTTFIIAHRLSTVRNADKILVLDRGILVECGTHDQLMAQQGLYYHLAQQQLDL